MEGIDLGELQNRIDQILDMTIADMEGSHDLTIREVNKLEKGIGCCMIRELLDVPLYRIKQISGFGEKALTSLKDCLQEVQDKIAQLADEYDARKKTTFKKKGLKCIQCGNCCKVGGPCDWLGWRSSKHWSSRDNDFEGTCPELCDDGKCGIIIKARAGKLNLHPNALSSMNRILKGVCTAPKLRRKR